MTRPDSRKRGSPPRSSPRLPSPNATNARSSYDIHIERPEFDTELPTTTILDKPLVASPQEQGDLNPSIARRRAPSSVNSRPTSSHFGERRDESDQDQHSVIVRISRGSSSPIRHVRPPLSRHSFLVPKDRPSQEFEPYDLPRSRSPSAFVSRKQRRSHHYNSDDVSSDSDDSYYSAYRSKAKKSAKPWRKFVRKLKEHDNSMVKGWKEDIDTLLVYAGLFSAVLTAFIVESYKFLQQDTDQASATLLQLVANHLLGSAAPEVTSTDTAPFGQSAFAVRINILWFSSLVFSLAAASVGILAKQWLRDYVSTAAGSPREAARIRQFRHSAFVKWHIPEVVAILPVLLQFSLALFFIGLLDLLWSLNSVVAGVITLFVSLSLSFLVVTTLLPTLSSSSPHHSPQALAVLRLALVIKRLAVNILIKISKPLELERRPWPLYINFNLFAGRRRRDFRAWLQQQRHGRVLQNWRDWEKHLVKRREAQLDHKLLSGADALFMDDRMLAKIIRPCIGETDATTAVNCLIDILIQRAHGNDEGEPTWSHFDAQDRGMTTLLHLSADVLEKMHPSADEVSMARMLGIFGRLHRVAPFYATSLDHIYRRIHETLPLFLSSGDIVAQKAFKIISESQPHRRLVVDMVFDAKVITHIVTYAQKQRAKNESRVFYEACSVALRLAENMLKDRDRPPDDCNAVKRQILTLLTDLETHLSLSSGASPSPSLMIALLAYVAQNTYIFDSVRGLIDALRPTIGIGPHMSAFADRGHSDPADIRQAQEQLRRLFSPRARPRRRDALPVSEIEEMNLALPVVPGTPGIKQDEQANVIVLPNLCSE